MFEDQWQPVRCGQEEELVGNDASIFSFLVACHNYYIDRNALSATFVKYGPLLINSI